MMLICLEVRLTPMLAFCQRAQDCPRIEARTDENNELEGKGSHRLPCLLAVGYC